MLQHWTLRSDSGLQNNKCAWQTGLNRSSWSVSVRGHWDVRDGMLRTACFTWINKTGTLLKTASSIYFRRTMSVRHPVTFHTSSFFVRYALKKYTNAKLNSCWISVKYIHYNPTILQSRLFLSTLKLKTAKPKEFTNPLLRKLDLFSHRNNWHVHNYLPL